MTVKFASVKADLAKEAAGTWVPYPDWPGVRLKVRSLHVEPYVTARDLMMKQLAAEHNGLPVPREKMLSGLGRLYHQHILLDWDGFDEPYGADLALESLIDPEFRDLVVAVEWCAQKAGQAQLEFVERTEKNSERPSVGD